MGYDDQRQEKWGFLVILPTSVDDDAQIDWNTLLPEEDVTGWLWLDLKQRQIKVDITAAYTDREPG